MYQGTAYTVLFPVARAGKDSRGGKWGLGAGRVGQECEVGGA